MSTGALSARILGAGRGALNSKPSRAVAWGALATGAGLTAIGGGAVLAGGAAIFEGRQASAQWQRSRESAHMSRVLATAQEGPFGTGKRPYGMGPNFSNSAGMSLAMHYARNGTGIRDPFFSLAGLGGQGMNLAGAFIGRM